MRIRRRVMRAAKLSRVIRTAADQNRSATDRELLRLFAAGDQDAFEVLVRRHNGLVFNVCRRALANTQDAEDACQAVFVILARKAGSGQWQPSIANWLFATARRIGGRSARARLPSRKRSSRSIR
jgi:DNA-directed RNA polymerase specialized sigma24 family protein